MAQIPCAGSSANSALQPPAVWAYPGDIPRSLEPGVYKPRISGYTGRVLEVVLGWGTRIGSVSPGAPPPVAQRRTKGSRQTLGQRRKWGGGSVWQKNERKERKGGKAESRQTRREKSPEGSENSRMRDSLTHSSIQLTFTIIRSFCLYLSSTCASNTGGLSSTWGPGDLTLCDKM